MTKKLPTLKVGTRVYSEKHLQNGVIVEVRKANDGSNSSVYIVELDNGDVRHYMADELSAPEGKEQGEEEEE